MNIVGNRAVHLELEICFRVHVVHFCELLYYSQGRLPHRFSIQLLNGNSTSAAKSGHAKRSRL